MRSFRPLRDYFLRRCRWHLSIACAGCLVPLSNGWGAEVKLAWDAARGADVAGYEIKFGERNDRLDRTWNAGNTTFQTVSGLEAGKTYYFTVRAYGRDKSHVSPPSNMTSKWISSAPAALFSTSRIEGVAPLVVTLSDRSTGEVTTTSWQFGDGSSANGKTVVKSFTQPGTYAVSLTVVGPGGSNTIHKPRFITVYNKDTAVAPLPSGRPAESAENDSVRGIRQEEMIQPVAAYEFDESTGRTAIDRSGNGNDGTLKSARRVRKGYFGKALALTGKRNSVVTIPGTAALRLSHTMTLSAWIKIRSHAAGSLPVITKQGTPNTKAADNPAYFLNASSEYTVPSAGFRRDKNRREAFGWERSLEATDTARQWVHLAATYDGDAIRTYVNGSLVGSQYEAGTIDMTNGDLVIGGDGNGANFQGLIDSVRIYDQALSEAQIRAMMYTPIQ